MGPFPTAMRAGSAIALLALSGCYYPYGYYPGAYPYYAYGTVPANGAQQDVPVGTAGDSATRRSSSDDR